MNDIIKARHFRPITKRQIEILNLIDSYIKDNGYSPSCKDLSELMNVSSPNSASDAIKVLKKKGYLNSSEFISRSASISQRGRRLLDNIDNNDEYPENIDNYEELERDKNRQIGDSETINNFLKLNKQNKEVVSSLIIGLVNYPSLKEWAC
jgi:SOS-response transcriptional repressor LexA